MQALSVRLAVVARQWQSKKVLNAHCHPTSSQTWGQCTFSFNLANSNPVLDSAGGLLKWDEPELDYQYLCDPAKTNEIRENIENRKGIGNIDRVIELYKIWSQEKIVTHHPSKVALVEEACKIPNRSHPDVVHYGNIPKVIKEVGLKPQFEFQPKEFHELAEADGGSGVLRTKNLGIMTGSRSYFLKGGLAQLEKALIRYTLTHLAKRGFQLVSVPDLLHQRVLQNCGMTVDGERTQVHKLDPEHYGNVCLSGTSEMSLAAMYMNTIIEDLRKPVLLMAVSPCYRAEVSSIHEERGIYRVHQFSKVEMFGITAADTGDESEHLLHEFVSVQMDLFSSLGFQFQLLDMPLLELGAPAYHKYDIETWMCGRKIYGEISSASNCTDYQSRRLLIRYRCENGKMKFPHTVNGTACAIPRMLIALTENYQQNDESIAIPSVLKPFLNGLHKIDLSFSDKLYFLKAFPKAIK